MSFGSGCKKTPRAGTRDKLLDIASFAAKVSFMGREIKLDGGEIALLKTIGLTGAPLHGKLLLDRIGEMETAEFLDTLTGLIEQDYIVASKVNIRLVEDVERSFFRVNPSHTKDLRDAINPGRQRERARATRQRRT